MPDTLQLTDTIRTLLWQVRPQTESLHISVISVWAFVSLLFYVWFVQINNKELGAMFLGIFGWRNWGKPVRLTTVGVRIAEQRELFFFVFVWAGIGWFVYSFLPDMAFGWRIPVALFFVLLYYVVRVVTVRTVAALFEEEKFSSTVLKTGLYHDVLFCVAALPVLAFACAQSADIRLVFRQILLVIFLILLLYKILHLVYEGSRLSKFSNLHIFIYLCALEILLPLCLWKVFFGL